ncbi:hypothetical protein KC887_06785 [Candidatus Kaiserbacteria bacterium]|nr:hypothetical protein [Candidatus Kaiserbacteria bacterium]
MIGIIQKIIKIALFGIVSMLAFASPTYATSTAPYLEVTYTVQIPILETEDVDINVWKSWGLTRSESVGRLRSDSVEFVSSQAYSSNRHVFTRPFFTFDTSVIPSGAIINSASLNLYIESKLDQVNNPYYSYIAVLEGNPGDPTNITGDDYNDCSALDGAVLGSDKYDVTDILTGAYKAFNLNSSGLGWINTGGLTKLCMRDGHDIENQAFTSSGVWKSNLVGYSKD